jgi:hypothetical protein
MYVYEAELIDANLFSEIIQLSLRSDLQNMQQYIGHTSTASDLEATLMHHWKVKILHYLKFVYEIYCHVREWLSSGFSIGDWIYWPLYHTTRDYK